MADSTAPIWVTAHTTSHHRESMTASVVRLFALHYIGWNKTLLGGDFNKPGRIFWSEATQRFLLQHFSRKTRAALQIYSCRKWIAVLFVQNSWWKRRDAECALVSSNLITFVGSCEVLAKIVHIPFFFFISAKKFFPLCVFYKHRQEFIFYMMPRSWSVGVQTVASFVEQTDEVDTANKTWLCITHMPTCTQSLSSHSFPWKTSFSSRPFLILSCKVCHALCLSNHFCSPVAFHFGKNQYIPLSTFPLSSPVFSAALDGMQPSPVKKKM